MVNILDITAAGFVPEGKVEYSKDGMVIRTRRCKKHRTPEEKARARSKAKRRKTELQLIAKTKPRGSKTRKKGKKKKKKKKGGIIPKILSVLKKLVSAPKASKKTSEPSPKGSRKTAVPSPKKSKKTE